MQFDLHRCRSSKAVFDMELDAKQDELTINESDIRSSVALLEKLLRRPELLSLVPEEDRIALLRAAGQLAHPDRSEKKKRRKAVKQAKWQAIVAEDRAARANTGIRQARKTQVFSAPRMIAETEREQLPAPHLQNARRCYVCDKEYTKLHFFYDSMCTDCGDFNYKKRFQTASLHGRVALITGARLKIGYQAAIMMLRAGAHVIATTRFPVDAAVRFSKEEDFPAWAHRLDIFGLDLRHTPSVEIFANMIETRYDRLDILINNAAQTVRRPPAFYAHLMAEEEKAWGDLPHLVQALLRNHEDLKEQLLAFESGKTIASSDRALSWHGRLPGIGIRSSAALSQLPYTHDEHHSIEEIFPTGQLDADLQQLDLRTVNSWRLRLGEIRTAEMLELQLINSVAPFVLCNRLVSMMRRDFTGQKHIVNVSAIEGKFYRYKKPDRHPHTNMAKAALNMLTHTSASDLEKDGIYMNAVDTGWVTDEDPMLLAKFKEEKHDFQPPLDIVDGAARVCDPFFDGILTGKHWCGKFLKDYFPIDW